MLAKLERAYLGILRVVVLIAATIALVVAALGIIAAAPSLLRMTGIMQSDEATGATLQDFISEQKITDTTDVSGEQTEQKRSFLAEIEEAARNIRSYLGKRGTITEETWKTALQDNADGFESHEAAYAASVKALSEELTESKGKPLSEARVVQLVEWHKAHFLANLQAAQAGAAADRANFWVTVGAAGGAFLIFILIVFVFLFVKIERSLRVVQTQRVPNGEEMAWEEA